MLTARRPRKRPNSTAPLTSANSVSSLPRPTFVPGWKCVPRWRTMISPAFTTWPPNLLTPSRWALESRPCLLDEAPFLCAISGLLLAAAGLAGTDAGDLHLGVLLTVPLTAPVASLVLVVDHVDLGPADRAEDLGCDLVAAKLGAVGDHLAAINDEHGRQRHGGANLTGELVDGQDVVHRRPFLPAAAANDRVHERTLSSWGQPAVGAGSSSRPRPTPSRSTRCRFKTEAAGFTNRRAADRWKQHRRRQGAPTTKNIRH